MLTEAGSQGRCNSSTRRRMEQGIRVGGKFPASLRMGDMDHLFLHQLHVRVIGSNKAELENVVMELKPLWESLLVIYGVITRSCDNSSAPLTC